MKCSTCGREPDRREDELFGVPLSHLDRMAGWFEETFGWLPMPDGNGAMEVIKEFERRWGDRYPATIELPFNYQRPSNLLWRVTVVRNVVWAMHGGRLRSVAA